MLLSLNTLLWTKKLIVQSQRISVYIIQAIIKQQGMYRFKFDAYTYVEQVALKVDHLDVLPVGKSILVITAMPIVRPDVN